jgi:hypothetical protein
VQTPLVVSLASVLMDTQVMVWSMAPGALISTNANWVYTHVQMRQSAPMVPATTRAAVDPVSLEMVMMVLLCLGAQIAQTSMNVQPPILI